MKVTLTRQNDAFLFEGKGATGHSVFIDNKTLDDVQGSSPMELLLMAVGSCNAIDIVSILNKQKQQIDSYSINVEGERIDVNKAKPFKAIAVQIYLEGDIDPHKALRAAELSFTKYCSVSMTIGDAVDISYEVFVNGNKVEK